MSIEKFVAFLGPVRTGHTLVASLLSAHPDIAIALEIHSLYKIVHHKKTKQDILDVIIKHCRSRSRFKKGGYDYIIPESSQLSVRNVKLVGDSMAGIKYMKRLLKGNNLKKFCETLHMPIKWILVYRNPFNNIQSLNSMNEKGIDSNISLFIDTVNMTKQACESKYIKNDLMTLYLEDFIEDPNLWLLKLTKFLGVNSSKEYISMCAERVFSNPHIVFDRKTWKKVQIKNLQNFMENTPELVRYL